VRLVHELLTKIGKDSGLEVYGLEDIETAVDLRAIKNSPYAMISSLKIEGGSRI